VAVRSVRRAMPKPKSTPTWRIHVIRKKGEYLGTVEAPTAEAAVQVAIKEYDITDPERRKRLVASRVR
jgi:hypothetical protein